MLGGCKEQHWSYINQCDLCLFLYSTLSIFYILWHVDCVIIPTKGSVWRWLVRTSFYDIHITQRSGCLFESQQGSAYVKDRIETLSPSFFSCRDVIYTRRQTVMRLHVSECVMVVMFTSMAN